MAAAATWTCETCTYQNAPAMGYCEMCEMSRPEEGKTFWRCDLCDEECTEQRFHTEGTGPDSIEDLCPTCHRYNTGSGQMFAGVSFVKICDTAAARGGKPKSKSTSKPKAGARTKLKKKTQAKPVPAVAVNDAEATSMGANPTQTHKTGVQDSDSAEHSTEELSNRSKAHQKNDASTAEKPTAAISRKRNRARRSKPADSDASTVGASCDVGSASFAAAAAAPEGSRRRGDLQRARERASAYALGLDTAPTGGASGIAAIGPSSSSSEDDDDADDGAEQGGGWDGPFAIARQMGRSARRERKARRRAARNGAGSGAQAPAEEPPLELEWTPHRGPRRAAAQHSPLPSLETLALRCLVQNFDALVALGAVTHRVRSDIGAELCKHGALTSEALTVLMDETGMDPWVEGWSEVELSDCAKVEEQAMLKMLRAPVPARLVRLELKSCGRGFGSKAADALGPQCPTLATLKLHGCYRLYDADILGILRRSPALTSLALEHAAELTVTTLEVTVCPHLPSDSLSNRILLVVDRCFGALQALADGLVPQLEHLSLSGCPHLCVAPEYGASKAVAMEQLARADMRRLNKLDLSHNPTLSASTLSRVLSHHVPTLHCE